MGFWIFCLAMNLLVPVIMLFLGRRFQTKPPKTINGVYGYRTARSIKSQQTWDFAHRYCGKLWFCLGLVLLPVSICATLPSLGKDVNAIGLWCVVVEGIQLVVLIGSIFPVERALKNNFDDFGRKR